MRRLEQWGRYSGCMWQYAAVPSTSMLRSHLNSVLPCLDVTFEKEDVGHPDGRGSLSCRVGVLLAPGHEGGKRSPDADVVRVFSGRSEDILCWLLLKASSRSSRQL